MSRGLGELQRRVLDIAAEPTTVAELADATGRSQSQVRNAICTLRKRGLIATRRTRLRWDPASYRQTSRHFDWDGEGTCKFVRAVPGVEIVSEQALKERVRELQKVGRGLLSGSEIRALLGY